MALLFIYGVLTPGTGQQLGQENNHPLDVTRLRPVILFNEKGVPFQAKKYVLRDSSNNSCLTAPYLAMFNAKGTLMCWDLPQKMKSLLLESFSHTPYQITN